MWPPSCSVASRGGPPSVTKFIGVNSYAQCAPSIPQQSTLSVRLWQKITWVKFDFSSAKISIYLGLASATLLDDALKKSQSHNFIMSSGYTCQRCLHSLARLGSPRSPSALSRSGPRRGLNSAATKLNVRNGSRSKSISQQRRTVSSIETQAQTSNEDQPTISSSPGLADKPAGTLSGNVLLQPNNLFHHFSESPSPEIRRRAAFMRSHAYCPHPSHHRTRMSLSPNDSEARKEKTTQAPALVRFECPDCGLPVSCSEDHWADDYESHMEICDTLRQVNEDDHDLRSGRFFPEFEYPGPQMEEALVNMTNWDTYLYTREYNAINEDRSLRQATRLLTYPVTIGSILSELSPYDYKKGDRLTVEGLKSLSGMKIA